MKQRWAVTAAVATALAATGVVTATTAHAATGCQVTYTVSSHWPDGFGANVSISNLGDPVSGWQLSWSFGAGQAVTQLWNGSYTQSGAQVTVTNVAWNASIPSGGTASFGFNASWNNSNNAEPTAFTLNGVACTGGVTTPPTTDSPSPSTSPTSPPPQPGQLPCDL